MLKLYVWHDVLTDWTSGKAFALAENEYQARELIARTLDAEEQTQDAAAVRGALREWRDAPSVHDAPVAFHVRGGA